MPAADDAFVALATWLARDASPATSSEPESVAPETPPCEPAQLDAFARELRLVRARLADLEDALAARQ